MVLVLFSSLPLSTPTFYDKFPQTSLAFSEFEKVTYAQYRDLDNMRLVTINSVTNPDYLLEDESSSPLAASDSVSIETLLPSGIVCTPSFSGLARHCPFQESTVSKGFPSHR